MWADTHTVARRNRIRRLKNNGATQELIKKYETDRLRWIQAGCPGSFHNFRNEKLAVSA